MKLADNPAKILFPQDGQWSPFYESQHQVIRRGTFPVATILLADDSLTTQKVVNLTFADEGVEVIMADDGDTALQLFHERQPDVVLADVNIPGLNGYEVCEAIRKTNDSQKTPVVLLVGSFEPFDAQEAHRVGANDYLTKPFSSIRRLVATVLAFLDEPPSTAEPASTLDEVEEITVEPTSPESETMASQVQESSMESQGSESTPTEHSSPVTGMPEPDMYATNDIEDLYTQSFAETVEMPHTIAERARLNDGSADDDLIETTYTEQAQQVLEPSPDEPRVTEEILQPIVHTESPVFEMPEQHNEHHHQISYETTKLPAVDFAAEPTVEPAGFQVEPASSVETPASAGIYDSPEPVQEVRPQDAPTEEYNFEYRSEETYFEPAAVEQPEAPEQVEEAREQLPEPVVETSQSQTEEQLPKPTPWESVAPADREFRLDESNLLELPVDSGHFSANDLDKDVAETRPGEAMSAETVERIARIVASQMSEQLIREIAERVVPMVVEETLARRTKEEVNT
jgi:CheY-like chemotaxis protein